MLTSAFADEHAAALEAIQEEGRPATFLRTTRTEDPDTGQTVPSTSSVSGYAIRVKGDPLRFQALGIVERDVVVLLFAASTFGDEVRPGDTVRWPDTGLPGSGKAYTVRDVDAVAPDGPSIIARVTVAR